MFKTRDKTTKNIKNDNSFKKTGKDHQNIEKSQKFFKREKRRQKC